MKTRTEITDLKDLKAGDLAVLGDQEHALGQIESGRVVWKACALDVSVLQALGFQFYRKREAIAESVAHRNAVHGMIAALPSHFPSGLCWVSTRKPILFEGDWVLLLGKIIEMRSRFSDSERCKGINEGIVRSLDAVREFFGASLDEPVPYSDGSGVYFPGAGDSGKHSDPGEQGEQA